MSIATTPTRAFILPPNGKDIPARCYGIIHIGTHPIWWNGLPKMRPLVEFKFELSDKLMDAKDDEERRPFSITGRYTNSLYEKARLRGVVEGLLGRELFDDELVDGVEFSTLLGMACQLTIEHKQSKRQPSETVAIIKAVGPVAEGRAVPPLVNPVVYYEVQDGINGTFIWFPGRLQQKISECHEWQQSPPPGMRKVNSPLQTEVLL